MSNAMEQVRNRFWSSLMLADPCSVFC